MIGAAGGPKAEMPLATPIAAQPAAVSAKLHTSAASALESLFVAATASAAPEPTALTGVTTYVYAAALILDAGITAKFKSVPAVVRFSALTVKLVPSEPRAVIRK